MKSLPASLRILNDALEKQAHATLRESSNRSQSSPTGYGNIVHAIWVTIDDTRIGLTMANAKVNM